MRSELEISRKDALKAIILSAAAAALPASVLGQSAKPTNELTGEDLVAIEKMAGLEFTANERQDILSSVRGSQADIKAIQALDLEQKWMPAVSFMAPDSEPQAPSRASVRTGRAGVTQRKGRSDDQIGFLTAGELGGLLRSKQISSVELTNLYLARLQKHNPSLNCVVALTPERALAQAKRADEELAKGIDRGPLHGLPYGAKDIFETEGILTTWGAAPHKDRIGKFDAEVIRRLEAAGAVLVAKLSTGCLALDDKWHGGQTKNPWNLKQGSSGSSAGPGCATAAGLVAFSIGSETLGSIMSPSQRCRTSGLRPSFGRVSRHGAMELSYSMDKVGPICRSIEDCALVFAAIAGADRQDPTTINRPFRYRSLGSLKGKRIGYLIAPEKLAADPLAQALRKLGAVVEVAKVTPFPPGITLLLDVECAAGFEAFIRIGLVRQIEYSDWPNNFRTARHIPAVEYVSAQRARAMMMERLDQELAPYDAIIDEGIGEQTIVQTNMAGTPQAIIPFGGGVSKSFVGKRHGEDRLLEIADAAQRAFGFHREYPPMG